MSTRTSFDARVLADIYGLDLRKDFFTLRSTEVERVLAAADAWRYRKPRAANGSRARYFFNYLKRLAATGVQS